MTEWHREAVLEGLLNALRGEEWFRTVRRLEFAALEPGELPAAVLREDAEQVFPMSPELVFVVLTVAVVVAVRADAIEYLGPTLSGARGRAIIALMADPTLGGVASAVLHRSTSAPELSAEPGRPPWATMVLTFEVEYFEGSRDPRVD